MNASATPPGPPPVTTPVCFVGLVVGNDGARSGGGCRVVGQDGLSKFTPEQTALVGDAFDAARANTPLSSLVAKVNREVKPGSHQVEVVFNGVTFSGEASTVLAVINSLTEKPGPMGGLPFEIEAPLAVSPAESTFRAKTGTNG